VKDKIIIFIIGVLVGAVISSLAFYIYTTTSNSFDNSSNNMEMNGGPPEMPNGENGQPPEMPNGENGQPPEMPNRQSQNNG